MNTIAIVFRKELIDTLRDRRTLLFMIVLPLLLFPVLFKVFFEAQRIGADRAESQVLQVAVIGNAGAEELRRILSEQDGIEVAVSASSDSIATYVAEGSLDGALVLDGGFTGDRAGRVDFYFRSTGDEWGARVRIDKALRKFEKELLAHRLQQLGLSNDDLETLQVVRHNLASQKEQLGARFGGVVPYVFILFCFLGAMYPAIDLGAGEKERGTMETLLTTPADRFGILLGKFGVVVATGFSSAVVSVIGLYLGVRQAGNLPPEMVDSILKLLGANTLLLLLSFLLPLTVFFAGLLLSVSLTARSFKEAQSLMTPLNIAVIVPVAIGMLPGIALDWKTALVPVLNVALATKEVLGGGAESTDLVLVYSSLVLCALASIWCARLLFRRESILFRD
jgi:sodium transport system permease protein